MIRIINELISIINSYYFDNNNEKWKNVLNFDLFGGIFNITIITINNDIFEITIICSDINFEVENFDNKLFNYYKKDFKEQNEMAFLIIKK